MLRRIELYEIRVPGMVLPYRYQVVVLHSVACTYPRHASQLVAELVGAALERENASSYCVKNITKSWLFQIAVNET
jgi:hypothetical protein